MDGPRTDEGDDHLLRLLRERFGHDRFRPGQRDVIAATLAGRDALAIMPTGAGKSLTFQMPALANGRLTLVVSPLIALMRDQVAGAVSRGLAAATVDSTMPSGARDRVLRDAVEGRLDLLYAAPEGLPRVLDALRGSGSVGLLAVDEAHCISEWGHDFRPAYLGLAVAHEALPGVPVLAVTATATPRVADDIASSLALRDPFVLRGSFYRGNLLIAARRKDRLVPLTGEIVRIAAANDGGSGIVYCLSRRSAGALASALSRRGAPAAVYHAGLEPAARARVQDAFAAGSVRTVVATIAFGMGVDKSDVRFVVHADLPGSIEAYAQEIGRAGRDGAPSACVLFYSWPDVRRRDRFWDGAEPSRREALRRRVREVYRFAADQRSCRHRALAAHFGETIGPCVASCDVCADPSPRARGSGAPAGRMPSDQPARPFEE